MSAQSSEPVVVKVDKNRRSEIVEELQKMGLNVVEPTVPIPGSSYVRGSIAPEKKESLRKIAGVENVFQEGLVYPAAGR
jgi:hypothetical protein